MPSNKKKTNKSKSNPSKLPEQSLTKAGYLEGIGTGDGFTSSGNVSKPLIEEIMRRNMVMNTTDEDWITRFTRFGYLDPYNNMGCNKEYIFFTKPDLHLFDGDGLSSELKDNTYFQDCYKRFRHIMKQLQYSKDKSRPHLAMLTNQIASSLDLPDIVGLESDSNENIYGDKITYRHGSESGDVGHEFSLEFYDTKYLEVYNLFKMWDMYENLKTKGKVTPPNKSYIENMELHDQISIYKFIVADDMETILFYAKLYGVYPKGVPRSQFGSLENGPIKLNVDFKSAFVLDNDPTILDDFNRVRIIGTNYDSVTKIPTANIWDKEYQKVDVRFVGKPFVVKDSSVPIGTGAGSSGVYKLKWTEVKY